MMAAAVRTGAAFSTGNPVKLFETATTPGSEVEATYDVAPDGRRFIMMEPKDQGASLRQIHVVLNWFTELEARAPTGR
jgi:hypothetical protein